MEKDIQNNLPTVMFRGTPCIKDLKAKRLKDDLKGAL